MHPVLVDIPLPRTALPLTLVLAWAVLAGAVIALLGHRAKKKDLRALGVVVAGASLLALPGARGQSLLLAPAPVYSFGALLSLGLLGGWFLSQRLADRDGLSRDAVALAYVVAAASGILGARLLYVLTNLSDFHSVADALAFRGGGLVFYGGFLGGALGSWLASRRRGLPFLALADVGAPALAFGASIGRLGCYLAGCDYGARLPESAPAFLARLGSFPRWTEPLGGEAAGSPAWLDQVLRGVLPIDAPRSLPVHPAQLYEAAGAAGLLAGLLVLGKHRRFRGQVFLAFALGYGALRYLLEIVRDDPERGFYGPLAAPRVLLPLGAAVVAGAIVAGPVESLPSRRARGAALAAAIGVVVSLYVVLSRAGGGPMRLSTSQWIAVFTCLAAGLIWQRLESPAGGGVVPGPEPAKAAS